MEEEARKYNLPINYKNPGKWRSIPIPNLVEGIVVGFIFEYFLMKIPFTFQFRIVTLIVTFLLKYLWKIVTNKYSYHMRKVGVKDVEALENRNSGTGNKQSNFTKLIASFKTRKNTEDTESESKS